MSQNEEKQKNGTSIVPLSDSSMRALRLIDEKATLLAAARERALRYTRPVHWVDESGKPYLTENGATDVAKLFNVRIFDVTSQQDRIKHTDNPQEDEIVFTYSGNIEIEGLGIFTGIGACTTRDRLYGTKGGESLPLSMVPIANVMRKAHTNMTRRLIVHALSMEGLTWEYLATLGIKKEDCVKVERSGHGGKAELSEEQEEKLLKIKEMAKYVFNNNAAEAKRFYIDCTQFQYTDKKTGEVRNVKGKQDPNQFTGAQIENFVYPRLLDRYNQMKEVEKGAQKEMFDGDNNGE